MLDTYIKKKDWEMCGIIYHWIVVDSHSGLTLHFGAYKEAKLYYLQLKRARL